jgi:toxin ParE1/3/4
MLPFRVLRQARRELLEAALWYKREQDLELAREFGTSYRAQLARARRLPESGQLVTGLPGDIGFEVRKFFLERFPYATIIACMPNELIVVAVAHQQRRPRYWASRLRKVARP